MKHPTGTVLLTNGATPYQTPVFDRVAEALERFIVVYDKLIEPGRHWDLGPLSHRHAVRDSMRWRELRKELGRRGCLIVTHLSPRSVAYATAMALSGGRVIYFTDGGGLSERGLDGWRKAARAVFVPRFDGFLAGTPDAERHLIERYGVDPARIFASYLCPVDVFRPGLEPRAFDIVIGGRDVWEKNNEFSIAVCAALGLKRPLRIAVFGDVGGRTSLGPVRGLRGVSVTHFGPLPPPELAQLFSRSAVFLMPSRREPWGLALHEALRCGCAAVASPMVTSARYLKGHYSNAWVCELECARWEEVVGAALNNAAPSDAMGVDLYSIDNAVAGIVSAVRGERRTA